MALPFPVSVVCSQINVFSEWSKALDLGSSHCDGVGSNPTAAKIFSVFSDWSKAQDLGSSHFDGVGSNPNAAKYFRLFTFFLNAEVSPKNMALQFPISGVCKNK